MIFVAGLAFIITGHILVKKQKAFFVPHVNLTEEELTKIKNERVEKIEKEKQALKQKKETKEKEPPKEKQE